MNEIVLRGCNADSLLGYLKAVGVLRLFAEQRDRASRGGWKDGNFILHTTASSNEVLSFFIERYQPTPVFNPWNKSAGFDGKKADRPSKLLDRIRNGKDMRWIPTQETLKVLDALDIPTLRESGDKEQLLRLLRSKYPDAALPWLDAVVTVGVKSKFSTLLGSGGNDGRLDFSVNFLERLIELFEDRALVERETLIQDALFGTSRSKAVASAIGQFSLRYAAGANSTTGFNADSLINPWDFALLIEGSMVYAGGLSKSRSARSPIPSYPFTFESTAAGFASASNDEETRGEIWLPCWSGAASAMGIRTLFRIGCMDAPQKSAGAKSVTHIASAQKAIEAAEAVLTLGSGIGISAFERVIIGKRNGLAFGALSVGAISVTSDSAIRGLSSEARRWIEGVRRAATMKSGHREPRLTAAVQATDEAIFSYARVPINQKSARAHALQEVLIALAGLDRACHAAANRKNELNPLGFLPKSLYEVLDEGADSEHWIARALAGYGEEERYKEQRLRFKIAPVAMQERRMVYADRLPEHWVPTKPLHSLGMLYQERLRLAVSPVSGATQAIESSNPVSLTEIAAIFDKNVDPTRLSQLIEAYALIDPAPPQPLQSYEEEPQIPAAYAVTRLALDQLRRGDLRIIDLLLARRTKYALHEAFSRLRTIDGLPGIPRDVRAATDIDHGALAAALAVPILCDARTYTPLLQAGLRGNITRQMTKTYLKKDIV
jgi:CRISPR-associated protein Csx17